MKYFLFFYFCTDQHYLWYRKRVGPEQSSKAAGIAETGHEAQTFDLSSNCCVPKALQLQRSKQLHTSSEPDTECICTLPPTLLLSIPAISYLMYFFFFIRLKTQESGIWYMHRLKQSLCCPASAVHLYGKEHNIH